MCTLIVFDSIWIVSRRNRSSSRFYSTIDQLISFTFRVLKQINIAVVVIVLTGYSSQPIELHQSWKSVIDDDDTTSIWEKELKKKKRSSGLGDITQIWFIAEWVTANWFMDILCYWALTRASTVVVWFDDQRRNETIRFNRHGFHQDHVFLTAVSECAVNWIIFSCDLKYSLMTMVREDILFIFRISIFSFFRLCCWE